MSFLGRFLCRLSAPFLIGLFGFFDIVFLILSCMSYLYFLGNNPMLVISFANIFSYSLGHCLILSMVSFAVQYLASLIKFNLFMFAVVSLALGN